MKKNDRNKLSNLETKMRKMIEGRDETKLIKIRKKIDKMISIYINLIQISKNL